MIYLKRFKELKTKGAISVVKAGSDYAVVYKRYDDSTGEVLPDEVLSQNIKELTDRKAELEQEIAEINAFLAEVQKIV